jgi:hypothetical protein
MEGKPITDTTIPGDTAPIITTTRITRRHPTTIPMIEDM